MKDRMDCGQYQLVFLLMLFAATTGGIYTGEVFSGAEDFLSLLLFLVTGAAFYAVRKKSALTWPAFVLAFWLLGSWRFLYAADVPPTDISNLTGQTVKIHAVVINEPRVTNDEITGGEKIRYTAEMRDVTSQQKQTAATGRLFVYERRLPGESAMVAEIGDEITAVGKLYHPQEYGNPGRMDTVNMLKNQGITAQISAGKIGVSVAKAVNPPPQYIVLRCLSKVREHYRRALATVMPQKDVAVVMGMLFGGYGGVPRSVVEDFTATGIVHIMSVSGSHISLIAAFAAWFGNLWGRLKRWRTLIVVGVIVFYATLAGLEPPVVRAAVMGTLVFWALGLGRAKDGQRLLVIVALGMIITSPLLVFHIGFQLSVMSTAGLLFLAPVVRGILCRKHWPDYLAASVAVSLGAIIFTVPVVAWYFNRLSVVAVAANLLVLPWVDFLIVTALAGGLISFMFPFWTTIIFAPVAFMWQAVAKLTHTLAQVPGATVYVPTFAAVAVIIYYAVLIGCVIGEARRKCVVTFCRHRANILCILLLCVTCWGVYVYRIKPPEVAVHFIDVGQGDAALLTTPHGKAVMFDTGGTRGNVFDVGEKIDLPYLRHYGIRELAAIFLTHAHEDHAAGAGSLLRALPVECVFTAGEGRAVYEKSLSLSADENLSEKLTVANEGQTVTIDGVTITTVYAPTVTTSEAGNEASNVYRISYGNFSVLITGDIEAASEEELVAAGKIAPCSVLKMAHHGSRTSSTAEFLRAAAPQAVIFCVGRDNSFGHPHAEVLARVKESGTKIYRTDEDGAVIFTSDGRTMRTETFYGSGRKQ